MRPRPHFNGCRAALDLNFILSVCKILVHAMECATVYKVRCWRFKFMLIFVLAGIVFCQNVRATSRAVNLLVISLNFIVVKRRIGENNLN
jgi:hypothetical protein